MEVKQIFWCRSCLNMSTRPRISFNEDGDCNACQWVDEKKEINWDFRKKQLEGLIKKVKGKASFDCIVPVSGGKDGSYVAYKLKHELGLNPLCVTIRPALELDLGDKNLKNFIESGYNHVHITPSSNAMQKLNKLGFIHKGFPYYGWLMGILTAVVRTAINYNIPLIFYGESGEIEYGGSSEIKNKPTYDVDYMKRIYLESGYEKILELADLSPDEAYFFTFPDQSSIDNVGLEMAHWGYFESWDPYRNYLIAKEHCGLQEKEDTNSGTFTNFAQNDQALYALHTYLMYLKFGFGRATQDAGIEIRRGAMSRNQAVNLVKLYDGVYPENFIDLYLEYYEMSKEDFDLVLDKWANKDLFEKKGDRWVPTFSVE